jgi:predicted nuclease of predicted toxin-antitoxin system
MRFLFDESVECRIAERIRALGHDVEVVGVDHPASILDPDVLKIALNTQRILITNDTDFGELVISRGLEHSGVILLRLDPMTAREKSEHLVRLLAGFADQMDAFIVVSASGVRVRRGGV